MTEPIPDAREHRPPAGGSGGRMSMTCECTSTSGSTPRRDPDCPITRSKSATHAPIREPSRSEPSAWPRSRSHRPTRPHDGDRERRDRDAPAPARGRAPGRSACTGRPPGSSPRRHARHGRAGGRHPQRPAVAGARRRRPRDRRRATARQGPRDRLVRHERQGGAAGRHRRAPRRLRAASSASSPSAGVWQLAIVGIAAFGVIGAYASQTTRRQRAVVRRAAERRRRRSAAMALRCGSRRQLLRPAPRLAPDAVPRRTRGRAGSNWPADRPAPLPASRPARPPPAPSSVGATGRRLATRYDLGSQPRPTSRCRVADARSPPLPTDVDAPVAGVSPFFTPNADFYRIDTALTVPQVSVDDVAARDQRHGRPTRSTLSYDDLLARPIVEADITLTCVSNEVGGSLRRQRPLARRAPRRPARRGRHRPRRRPDRRPLGRRLHVRLPRRRARRPRRPRRDRHERRAAAARARLPGPPDRARPVRLRVGDQVARARSSSPASTDFDQYWVRARLGRRRRRSSCRAGSTRRAGSVEGPRRHASPIAGVAWAQTRGIDARRGADRRRRLGGGRPSPPSSNDDTWRQWSYAWDATPGRHSIRVRATETRTDAIQTDERSEPFPSGATGQHQIVVIVE